MAALTELHKLDSLQETEVSHNSGGWKTDPGVAYLDSCKAAHPILRLQSSHICTWSKKH